LIDVHETARAPVTDELTIFHLLTMTVGQRPEDFQTIWQEKDWVSAFFRTPLSAAPGTTFEYNNFCSFILSAIIQRVTGQRLLDYLATRLFDPLGIHERYWEQLGMGIDWGASGLYISVESMARFGYFLLNRGIWDGEQLLDPEFITSIGTKHVASHRKEVPAWIEDSQGYGLHAWQNSFGGFRASGALQQEIVVLPEQNLTASFSGGVVDVEWEPLSLFSAFLVPACETGYSGGDEALGKAAEEFEKPLSFPATTGVLTPMPQKTFHLEHPIVRWRTFHVDLHLEQIGIERSGERTFVTLVNRGTPSRLECRHDGSYAEGAMAYGINCRPFDLRPAVSGRWADGKSFEFVFRPLTRKMWMTFTIRFSNESTIELTVSLDKRHRVAPETVKGEATAQHHTGVHRDIEDLARSEGRVKL
jgi:hypothetical protein